MDHNQPFMHFIDHLISARTKQIISNITYADMNLPGKREWIAAITLGDVAEVNEVKVPWPLSLIKVGRKLPILDFDSRKSNTIKKKVGPLSQLEWHTITGMTYNLKPYSEIIGEMYYSARISIPKTEIGLKKIYSGLANIISHVEYGSSDKIQTFLHEMYNNTTFQLAQDRLNNYMIKAEPFVAVRLEIMSNQEKISKQESLEYAISIEGRREATRRTFPKKRDFKDFCSGALDAACDHQIDRLSQILDNRRTFPQVDRDRKSREKQVNIEARKIYGLFG